MERSQGAKHFRWTAWLLPFLFQLTEDVASCQPFSTALDNGRVILCDRIADPWVSTPWRASPSQVHTCRLRCACCARFQTDFKKQPPPPSLYSIFRKVEIICFASQSNQRSPPAAAAQSGTVYLGSTASSVLIPSERASQTQHFVALFLDSLLHFVTFSFKPKPIKPINADQTNAAEYLVC